MGRRSSRLAAATMAAVPLALAGCSTNGGQGLARQACAHVEDSIHLYLQAEKTPSKTVAREKLQRASLQLNLALPLAARANSANGQWDALMTTISESSRVTEGLLMSALSAQCTVADSNNPDQDPIPTTVPTTP